MDRRDFQAENIGIWTTSGVSVIHKCVHFEARATIKQRVKLHFFLSHCMA